MLMDYDEELRLLEEWLVNPNIEEDYIIVMDTKYPRIPNMKE
jgi:hypothetical protein